MAVWILFSGVSGSGSVKASCHFSSQNMVFALLPGFKLDKKCKIGLSEQKVITRFHDSVSSILLQAAMPATASMATSIVIRLFLVAVSSFVIITYSCGTPVVEFTTTLIRVNLVLAVWLFLMVKLKVFISFDESNVTGKDRV